MTPDLGSRYTNAQQSRIKIDRSKSIQFQAELNSKVPLMSLANLFPDEFNDKTLGRSGVARVPI